MNGNPVLPLHVEVSLRPEEVQISELAKLIAAELIKKTVNESKEKVGYFLRNYSVR